MKAVWGDSFVEEGNLSFTINLLRKTLGDDAQKPRFIKTVPRRGYCFIAEVREIFPRPNKIYSQSKFLRRRENFMPRLRL